MKKNNELKLIYVLKIGKNSKREYIYEFIFSKDIENVDIEMWNWDTNPASEQSTVPEKEYIDATYTLTTKDFKLFCLHEANDRPYIHGYHLIHAIAYEDIESEDDDEDDFDFEDLVDDNSDMPILVFHYGMTLKDVEDKLYERNIILKGENFINTNSITVK